MAVPLSIYAPYLIAAGLLAVVCATIWFIVVAFKRHIAWGLAVLLVPFANLVFLIRAWKVAKRPFILSLVGVVLCGIGLFFSPQSWSEVRALYAKIALLCRPQAAPTGVADPTAAKLAELHLREQRLLARKAALKPGDTAGAEALWLEIQAYNAELKALLARISPPTLRSDPADLWTMNPTAAAIPDTPVAGRIAGATFSIDHAWLENGSLTLRHGAGLFPEHEFVIVLTEQNPAGRSFRVPVQSGTEAPQVHVKSVGTNRKLEETKIFKDGYAMRLQFGQAADDEITGGIYLCLPDSEKSYLAGTFRARVVEKPGAVEKIGLGDKIGGGEKAGAVQTAGVLQNAAGTTVGH
jgi:hypothetical protein